MVHSMHGVTTAIVAFILACLIFPHVVKNKPQYYAAVGLVLLVILFEAIARMVNAPGFFKFVTLLTAIFQMAALFLLILSAGGLSVKDLAGDLADTIEVVRRGDQNKEIIIPLRGEVPGAGRARREAMRETEREGPGRITLDMPTAPPPQPARRDGEGDEDRGGIPLA